MTLRISGDGRSAKGSWQRPSGLGGPAEFDIDASCSLISGLWGMAGGEANRPWDTTGSVTRIDGADRGASGTDESTGSLMPGGHKGGKKLTDEQIDKLRSVRGPDELDWEAARRETERQKREAGQAELDRQQNEQERERRAEAEAREAAKAAAAKESQTTGKNPAGRPVPVGPPIFAGLSGSEGESKVPLDLETGFLRHISWAESRDKPCWIRLGNTTDGNSPPVPTEPIERVLSKCRGGLTVFSGPDFVEVEAEYPLAIGSIQVCQTFNRNNRIKGIRIRSMRINDDGTDWYKREDTNTNCRDRGWQELVLCGADKAATGLVVHYNRRSRDRAPYEFVGLELICRKIGLE